METQKVKIDVFCSHILILSRKVAKPQTMRRGKVTVKCCDKCKDIIKAGGIAKMIFDLADKAGIAAKKKKVEKKHLFIHLEMSKEGISLRRLERTKGSHYVNRWKVDKAEMIEIEDLERKAWRVIKNAC